MNWAYIVLYTYLPGLFLIGGGMVGFLLTRLLTRQNVIKVIAATVLWPIILPGIIVLHFLDL
jgi:hypothetical protein